MSYLYSLSHCELAACLHLEKYKLILFSPLLIIFNGRKLFIKALNREIEQIQFQT